MKNREELLVRIMHALGEKFRKDLVLKGGMLLRLLNCPRSTQDVNYIWLSTESRKVLARQVEQVFSGMPEIVLDAIALNSRGVFIDVASRDNPQIRGKIEITSQESLNLPSEGISTSALAGAFSLTGRIISTIALPEAFAHKIAASIERDVARDLYDLSQFEPLCSFDVPTLRDRLGRLEINRTKPRAISFQDAAKKLRDKIETVSEESLERELAPLLPEHQRKGLSLLIRAALSRIAAQVESVSDHQTVNMK